MHRIRVVPAIALLTCLTALPANAEDTGLKLRLQRELIPYERGEGEPEPMFLEADRVQGHQDRELEAEGKVRLRQRGEAIFAEYLYYAFPEQELTATGKVRLERHGDVVTGTKLVYNMQTETGHVESPTYNFQGYRARGDARRLEMQSRDRFLIEKATYTNCDVGDDDWYIRVNHLDLDRQTDVGVARDATVVFKGVPILYSPYLDFSLSGRRKSGLLAPTIGSTGQSGFEYTQPYYWNIAPNRDMTIAPRLMARRGVLLNTEGRYLEPNLSGEAHVEYLPDDRQTNESRYGYSWQHHQAFGYGFSGDLDLQGVSDDAYFTDLSDRISATSQTNLRRQGILFYDGDWWNASARVQKFQTLQDPLDPLVPPYARLPQLTLNANRQATRMVDLGMYGEYVNFDHPTLLNGQRQILYPSVAFPLQNSYFYVTPKLGFHSTTYSFEDGRPDETRELPIYSIDSAVTFERQTQFRGRDFIQTLEPRLYYVYIPFRRQDHLPNFDTALADFNLAQIFTENQFTGGDRINDANQLTAAVTSRFIDPTDGDEELRFTVGQRFYFKEQQVTLNDSSPRNFDRSDLLFGATGRIANHWYSDLGMQYSTNENRVERSNAALRYQPEIGKLLNLGYRFTRDTLEQVDISTQWPIRGRWMGIARWNYSLQDTRLLEGLAGVEYNAGCWTARFVMHRFVSATQEYVNAMFLQLELNGVSRIGSNPLDVMRQNIPGYVKTNDPAPPEVNPFPSY